VTPMPTRACATLSPGAAVMTSSRPCRHCDHIVERRVGGQPSDEHGRRVRIRHGEQRHSTGSGRGCRQTRSGRGRQIRRKMAIRGSFLSSACAGCVGFTGAILSGAAAADQFSLGASESLPVDCIESPEPGQAPRALR
jgi:hypothetical protein